MEKFIGLIIFGYPIDMKLKLIGLKKDKEIRSEISQWVDISSRMKEYSGELNSRVLSYSKDILKKYGKPVSVSHKKFRQRRFKSGNCFPNSVDVCHLGKFKYEEGGSNQ